VTPELAYVRDALFGIELLDAVTLGRVSQGVDVVAEGLHGKPIVNASGLFVWLREDLGRLRKVTIDPGLLPYERVELEPAQLTLPLTVVELRPRADYAFAAGVTGMRGALVEERSRRVPVRDAEVHLRWLDENGGFHDSPAPSHTDGHGGFVAVVRLAPADVPQLDPNGALTVRLRARRGINERGSPDLKLPQGHIAADLSFAWDELQP
jgi:hypothetical protein